jgi:HlyD family secretion protein
MRRLAKILVWLIVLGVGAAGIWYGPGLYRKHLAPASGGGGLAEARFHTAKRTTLRIGIVESGQVRALKNHTLSSQLNGRAKIAWVVPTSKAVKKGDKLIEFERQPIIDQIRLKEGELETARRQLTVAQEDLLIQRSAGKSAVATAQSLLEQARDALKQYRELDGPKKFRDLEGATSTGRKALADAQKAMLELQVKADEGLFVDEDQKAAMDKQIEATRRAVAGAEKGVEVCLLAHKMFKAYEYPQTFRARGQAHANAELDLAKAKVAARSLVLQKEAEIGKSQDSIRRIEVELADQRKELDKCVLTAPVDGVVLYGDPRQNVYYGGQQQEVKVGAEVWQGNTLLTIPDFSAFEIDISIGEEYRGKIKPDCKAVITIEAIPGLTLEGTLKSISQLAQSRVPWDQSSPKVYSGVVEIKSVDPRMVSGMTTRVQVVAETAEGVVAVPIEAVHDDEGKPVCYVHAAGAPEKRKVKPGRSNDDLVELVEGVSEGEQVYLFRPQEQAATAGKP